MEKNEDGFNTVILWKVLKKNILWLLITTVLCGVFAGVLTKSLSKVTYTAQVEFRIRSTATSASALSADIVEIVNSKTTVKNILEAAGIDVSNDTTVNKALNMVTASQVGSNALISVSVTGSNSDTVLQIAQAYEKYLPDYIAETIYSGNNTYLRVYQECPDTPTANRPAVKKNALIGAVAGFVVAYLVFFVLKLLDKKIYAAEELQALPAKAPIFGTIPTPTGKPQKFTELLALKRGTTSYTGMIPKPDENLPAPVAEAYRTLRTNLAYTAEKDQKRVFGVTSAATGDGKSVLTANLAIVYTQLGKRVLVLEADMRKPSMAQLFGAEAKVGLAEVLTGLVTDYQEALLHQNGVDVLTAGALPYNPAELLAGERMQTLVNEAREAYDLVLVDLPAMGEVSDAAVVAPLTDGYLVAVHAAYTDSRALRSTLEEMGLVSMQTIGFVLVGAGK